MNIWKYLNDQWWMFIGWFLFVVMTAFIIWLTPDVHLSVGTLGYLVLIQAVIFGIIVAIHYYSKKRWWNELTYKEGDSVLQQPLSIARNEEERLYQEFINQIIFEHQETMQEVLTSQEEQKDYIDSWVHEIKVPLAAMQLLLRSIEFDIEDDKFIAMENELLRMDEYVDQVLYVARLDSFSKDYLIRENSLKQIIQPVLRSQANYFIQKNIHFSIEGEDQQVLTDGKWIGFIFRQLLSNGIKYTPENGQIMIRISKKRKGVQLEIEDNGIGIPEEDMRRIFDKGFTGNNGRNDEIHSTGLGLYLAKNLAKQLGVKLYAKSTEGQGTKMTLFFPMLSYYEEER